MNTVFGDYSKYYDLLYATKDYEKEAAFVDDLLKKNASVPCRSVLELGSGTGKHAYYLAKRAYEINGVDLSAEMLEVAGNFLSQRDEEFAKKISLSQADIRTLRIGKKFDCAISLFHVMSYQTKNEDLKAVFQTVKEHVHQGGLFIFDVWYGPAVLTQLPEVRHKRFENEHGVIERIAVPTLNENQNTIEVHYHLFVNEKGQNHFYKIEEKHLMRYWFLPEIESMCAQFGMKLKYTCEWLTGKQLSQETWGACFIVQV